MAKALEVNDKTAENQELQAQQKSGDKTTTLQGKSFQVNENSVEEGESVSPAAGTATQAKWQITTVTTNLEAMTRRNPFGMMAGAVMVGVLVALVAPRRS